MHTVRYVCQHCTERGDCVLVRRKVGGSYNRAGAFRDRRICTDCVRRLAAKIQPGTMTTAQWSNSGLRTAAAALPPEPCRCMTEDPGDGYGERVVTHSGSCPDHPDNW